VGDYGDRGGGYKSSSSRCKRLSPRGWQPMRLLLLLLLFHVWRAVAVVVAVAGVGEGRILPNSQSQAVLVA
jgi:hypothetical protein